MKKIVIVAVALVIVSQAIAAYILDRRFRLVACSLIYRLCEQRCDDTLRDTLNGNNLQRGLATLAQRQALIDCNVQNVGDNAAREQCRQEATRAFDERMAQLDASDASARETRERCVAECRRQEEECRASNEDAFSSSTGPVTATVNVGGTITVDCIEGGAPCFKPVSEFCQRASVGCDQCWLSLCGGGEWTVETVGEQLPVNATLVAAADPSKNPRVLATSTARGNQAVLNVPTDIKLGEGEQLHFGFSSQRRLGGPVGVRIHRRK